MILVDANLLLYAYVPTTPLHKRARAWLEDLFSSSAQVRLTWVTILAFLRIATNPRIFEYPFSIDEAMAIVSAWFNQPAVAVLAPGERHWEILAEVLRKTQSRGASVMDAHLAALAIEHGATLCTNDQGFVRFPGLRLQNPLEE